MVRPKRYSWFGLRGNWPGRHAALNRLLYDWWRQFVLCAQRPSAQPGAITALSGRARKSQGKAMAQRRPASSRPCHCRTSRPERLKESCQGGRALATLTLGLKDVRYIHLLLKYLRTSALECGVVSTPRGQSNPPHVTKYIHITSSK